MLLLQGSNIATYCLLELHKKAKGSSEVIKLCDTWAALDPGPVFCLFEGNRQRCGLKAHTACTTQFPVVLKLYFFCFCCFSQWLCPALCGNELWGVFFDYSQCNLLGREQYERGIKVEWKAPCCVTIFTAFSWHDHLFSPERQNCKMSKMLKMRVIIVLTFAFLFMWINHYWPIRAFNFLYKI